MPRLDGKRSHIEHPRSQDVTASSSELQAFVERLNMVAKNVVDNDRRLNRIEKTMGSVRGDKVEILFFFFDIDGYLAMVR